jgi:hypothetical protein
MADRVSARLRVREARQFGLAVGSACVVLGALTWWRGRLLFPLLCGTFGVTLVLFGLLAPAVLVPVRRVWVGAAAGISKVTTPIFMGVVYLAILTPFGMIRRLSGHSPMTRQPQRGSLWIARDLRARKSEDMEHQF